MTDKIVLGLVGEIASGKSAVAEFLEKEFNSETASFSQPLRDILDILNLPQSRENMVWLGVDLRERFGQDILAKAVLNMVKKSQAAMICLPNIRLEGDINLLGTLPYFYLIKIKADAQIRYQRLRKRGENTDDATKTWEEFLNDANLPTEVTIREVGKQAQFTVKNDTSEDDLIKQIKEVILQIKRRVK
ncbi:MAG: hypothetical protein Q7K65_03910 [Candidatus Buchananbacteria bacterium]|nr:hypothetical protein [Candidatus Buchananbacteria bacterium]